MMLRKKSSSSSATDSVTGSYCYSLEGYLTLKVSGGTFDYLKSKKVFYFALEETTDTVYYFKERDDFIKKKKEPTGLIPLLTASCSDLLPNSTTFNITTQHRKYEFVAPNIQSALCWHGAIKHHCKNIQNTDETSTNEDSLAIFGIQEYHRSTSTSNNDIDWHKFSDEMKTLCNKSSKKKDENFEENEIPHENYKIKKRPSISTDPIRLYPSNKQLNISTSSKNTSPVHGRKSLSRSKRQSIKKNFSFNIKEHSIVNNVKKDDKNSKWVSNWVDKQKDETFYDNKHESDDKIEIDVLKESGIDIKTQQGMDINDPEDESDNLNVTLQDSGHSSGGDASHILLSRANSFSSGSTETFRSDQVSEMSSTTGLYNELIELRSLTQRQKETITQIIDENIQLKENIKELSDDIQSFKRRNSALLALDLTKATSHELEKALSEQVKYLNNENKEKDETIKNLQKKIDEASNKNLALECENDNQRREYVFLLQSCLRIPINESNSNLDTVQVRLFGGDVHEKRVKKLLDKARESDPSLPTFDSVMSTTNCYVDEYGFKHSFTDQSLALQYICTQLHAYYQSQTVEYADLKIKWKQILEQNTFGFKNRIEIRNLVRAGVPRSMRPNIWKILINQTVLDIKEKYGKYYYTNLSNSRGTLAEQHYSLYFQKQVQIDLLRTAPLSIYFNSATSSGVAKLENVLKNFCLYSASTVGMKGGYCQGLNFIASVALLFLSAEDSFWFLVAITEKYFPPSYYDENLTSAQAHMEVLKELIEVKLPKLAQHLEAYDIDLTTVTLNWFLTLFYDAVPFQTMLRIWDCFLVEGPKVLFRFSLALLALHEDELLKRTDTIGVMKVLKASVKLTYDCDGLIKAAFEDMNPMPSRNVLRQKHDAYVKLLEEKFNHKKKMRSQLAMMISPNNDIKENDLPISSLIINPYDKDRFAYVLMGHQKTGKIAIIEYNGSRRMELAKIEFDCKPVTMCFMNESTAFISLISGYIVAIEFVQGSLDVKTLWELKLRDVALKIFIFENRLYCILANGTLTVLENILDIAPTSLEIFNVNVAPGITDAIIVDDTLWIAVPSSKIIQICCR
ncbi:Rab-GTPase-TBC domain and Pleckstrin homology domain and Pleckstrin homology-like domain-containing protein [Strongyloides ratti]|uniref:Rab-GTPase-TBC domain and Pleckstrin homology domain and Pleckstrin homology-like domain-containing protein n=1 Tax=Strongyloides ratti TaxID=34506 RepID=A0A090L0R3_STRRB|nr:Rab-GTPase-TBC domain and Pleckstrin homology domain and Pleckstrin homology-like domain-containing protein [Strongyloides ratti]CEF63256.1 Rab-GTPase-TBC domain and Pleckstrin homology domain and Pleckstrin homology-like domain-containing protein [Strongyloides ratti]